MVCAAEHIDCYALVGGVAELRKICAVTGGGGGVAGDHDDAGGGEGGYRRRPCRSPCGEGRPLSRRGGDCVNAVSVRLRRHRRR